MNPEAFEQLGGGSCVRQTIASSGEGQYFVADLGLRSVVVVAEQRDGLGVELCIVGIDDRVSKCFDGNWNKDFKVLVAARNGRASCCIIINKTINP